jgi:hypothetical protein
MDLSNYFSFKFYVQANPDFLMELVGEMLELCPSEPKREGNAIKIYINFRILMV